MTGFQAKFAAAHDARAIAALRADARTERALFHLTLHQLHLTHRALMRLREDNLALREELRRYTAAMVRP